jgi:nicotinamide mononucleotide transporter
MSLFEIIGTIFGLASVVLTVREDIWCWPTGIVNIVLFMVMFFDARLYGDVVNYAVMLVLSIYGWYEWLRGGPRQGPLRVRFARRRERLVAGAVCLVGSPAMGYLFARYTDAALPYWDSVIAVTSMVAQVLLALKLVENWVLWIFVDLLAIGVYLAKSLYLTSGLYLIFLGLAAAGLVGWLRRV